MKFQFTHLYWLLALVPALAWVIWLAWKSDVQAARWRRWCSGSVRAVVLIALVLALAGFEALLPIEGLNVFFVLDRSESIPSAQQEAAREYVNRASSKKEKVDKSGVIVFGSEAGIESMPNEKIDLQKVQAVVGTERTDLAAAVRLGTAAFPEAGQKRLVLLTDGNENTGDAMSAVLAGRQLGVTVDVLPLGVARANDVSVQKVQVPARVNEGQAFEAKIFVQSDIRKRAVVRLYRNDQFLHEQAVDLEAGKNLFSLPQTLRDPGFYNYDVRVDVDGDPLPQNNRAIAFTTVRGKSRILIVSNDPGPDQTLAAALRSSLVDVQLSGIAGFPGSLAEMQSYDSIFLCNVAAGDIGLDRQKLLEAAVRDFGVGLVCVGGDQAYAAGGYRGTPLETTLPLSMELDSKKVLPNGAVVLVMHGMEFDNGNEVARLCAQGVLEALGPKDEMGVVLWDGFERWLFPLDKVGNRSSMRRQIAGMSQGDLGSFQGVLEMARQDLKKSKANLKHIIVFSDGDPGAPSPELMARIVSDKITVSSVLISGHAGPDTMTRMAEQGKGRFYDVRAASALPQIFVKETAVILKSAIYEEPFKPRLRSMTEMVGGITPAEYPQLLGYVATTPKPRAETPLWTDKGDPLLAHWQYGLGRAVAFTSDARAKWGREWIGWEKYRQFWSQAGQWSLRKLANSDFTTDVTVEKGQGLLQVEALDKQGNYINFLNLQAAVVSPKGERQAVRLEQTGPGHYEARFPTREVGAYMVNLTEWQDGKVRGSQVIGATVNYSPEFNVTGPNLNLLRRVADSAGGKVLSRDDLSVNPFSHNRQKTFRARELWPWLLKLVIVLFVLDVGVRRIQIGREELQAMLRWAGRLAWWRTPSKPAEAEVSLAALLNKRNEVRSTQTASGEQAGAELLKPRGPVTVVLPGDQPIPKAPVPPPPTPAPAIKAPGTPAPAEGTTARLLEARRRVQKRHDKGGQ